MSKEELLKHLTDFEILFGCAFILFLIGLIFSIIKLIIE